VRAPERITTARLVGTRPNSIFDMPLAKGLYGDDRVAATLWPGALGGARNADQTRAMIVDFGECWRTQGYGPWVFRHADDNRPIGVGGLRRTTIAGYDCIEVLYAVYADEWGKGFATEIATASVAVARDPLALPVIVCCTLPENAASLAVMRTVGFTDERMVEKDGLAHVLGVLYPTGATPQTA
jgi:RimJ/RimL family protein N-acetyltransferase